MIEYSVRVRLGSGRQLPSSPFFTNRERALGDVVRLPVRPDGELEPAERYDWRVVAFEDDGHLLVLEYEFPTAA